MLDAFPVLLNQMLVYGVLIPQERNPAKHWGFIITKCLLIILYRLDQYPMKLVCFITGYPGSIGYLRVLSGRNIYRYAATELNAWWTDKQLSGGKV